MSQEKTADTGCLICKRTATLKTNADVLQRLIARVLPKSSLGATLIPVRSAAASWTADIGACLKREMAPHPKCGGCGILMGPGHLELGTDGQCRSCFERSALGQKSGYATRIGPRVGRRGWHSDYAIKK
jgi:hypothetical protein